MVPTLTGIIACTGLEKFGWKRSDGKLEVIWEVPENIAKVQQRHSLAASVKRGVEQEDANASKKGKSVDQDADASYALM